MRTSLFMLLTVFLVSTSGFKFEAKLLFPFRVISGYVIKNPSFLGMVLERRLLEIALRLFSCVGR
jgi:hypothetical protein